MALLYSSKIWKRPKFLSYRRLPQVLIRGLGSGLLLMVAFFSHAQSSVSPPGLSGVAKELTMIPDSVETTDPNWSNNTQSVIRGIQYDSTFVGKKLRKRDQELTIFGYYRLFLYGRNMVEPYPNLDPFARAYGVGDGYREPMMSITVVGRPNGKASFGTELFMFTPYTGEGQAENVFTLNLGLNFYGNFRTRHGSYGIRAGGIHWYNLSPFTIGVFQVLDRFSIFDRTPWEGVTNSQKYENYFATGSTNPGDLRWNNQAFQGLVINGNKLPGGFAFDLFWGKTQPNGGLSGGLTDPFESIPPTLDAGEVPTYLGFNGTARNLSNFLTGGKLARSFGRKRHQLAYNVIHSHTDLDSLGKTNRSYQVHTLSLDLKLAKMKLAGELGAGSFQSPTYDKKWGEALMLRLYVPEEYTFVPLDIQFYRISQNFFNQNGEIATNSNPAILEGLGLPAGANGAGGQLTLVNQLVHNRQGVNLNTGIEVGAAKFNIGWSWSQELEANSVLLSYVHRVNGLALSRVYNPFPANATGPTVFGPYNRQVSFFRGVSEFVQTTDIDPGTATAQNRKFFNSVDIQGKAKATLLNRPLYFFYIGSFSSASGKSEAFPVFNDDSYLFVQYHEFDLYFEVLPKFILTGYFGFENARGGQFTDWDLESQLPRDQIGRGIGVGFDWTIAENAGIYVRHRWLSFEDRSFALDQYRGREITIELKSFF